MTARTNTGWVLAGRYVMTEVIGSGGMATVWRAFDRRVGREVAVKMLHRELIGRDQTRTRFEREGRHAASVAHPNIVIVYDVGADADRPFIVMELVVGASLRQLLDHVKHLSIPVASSIVTGVLCGLGEAHRQGILHRDIKPGNVLIDRNGTPKLADFGIAQARDWSTITEDGTFLGTALYAAPEQLVGSNVTGAADLFSTGRVLEECVVGSAVFASRQRHVLETELAIPQEFQKVLLAFTEPNPEHRPPSADAAAALLDPFVGSAASAKAELQTLAADKRADWDIATAGPPTPPMDQGADGLQSDRRRVRWAAPVAIAVIAAAVAGSVYALTSSGARPGTPAGPAHASPPSVAHRTAEMPSGEVLLPGESVVSSNGRFAFAMLRNGDLELQDGPSTPLWASGSGGHPGAYAVLQSDGDLVVYPQGGGPPGPGQPTSALWSSGTTGNPGATLSVSSSGNVAIRSGSSRTSIWQTETTVGFVGSQLAPGAQLHPEQYLLSPNSTYRLENIGGILKLSASSQPACTLWKQSSPSDRTAFAAMGSDGNLRLVTTNGSVLWSTRTSGNPGSVLTLQSNGKLYVLSQTGVTLWSAPTRPICRSGTR